MRRCNFFHVGFSLKTPPPPSPPSWSSLKEWHHVMTERSRCSGAEFTLRRRRAERCAARANQTGLFWQTGLLLQAADMHAILKRCHPQLHLTIYSTGTSEKTLLDFICITAAKVQLELNAFGFFSFIFFIKYRSCITPPAGSALSLRGFFSVSGYCSKFFSKVDQFLLSPTSIRWICSEQESKQRNSSSGQLFCSHRDADGHGQI